MWGHWVWLQAKKRNVNIDEMWIDFWLFFWYFYSWMSVSIKIIKRFMDPNFVRVIILREPVVTCFIVFLWKLYSTYDNRRLWLLHIVLSADKIWTIHAKISTHVHGSCVSVNFPFYVICLAVRSYINFSSYLDFFRIVTELCLVYIFDRGWDNEVNLQPGYSGRLDIIFGPRPLVLSGLLCENLIWIPVARFLLF